MAFGPVPPTMPADVDTMTEPVPNMRSITLTFTYTSLIHSFSINLVSRPIAPVWVIILRSVITYSVLPYLNHWAIGPPSSMKRPMSMNNIPKSRNSDGAPAIAADVVQKSENAKNIRPGIIPPKPESRKGQNSGLPCQSTFSPGSRWAAVNGDRSLEFNWYAGSSLFPHFPQYLMPSAFSKPQFVHLVLTPGFDIL